MPGSNGRCSRVLLVDDHPLYRSALRYLFAGEPDLGVCGEAGTLAAARRLTYELRPDLIVLDLALPDGDRLELLSEMNDWSHPPRVLVVTARDEDDPVCLDALRLGATAFLNKCADAGELIDAVRKVCAGETHLSEKVMRLILRRHT